MKQKIRRRQTAENRRIEDRLAGVVRVNEGGPIVRGDWIRYELAEKTKAIAYGGIDEERRDDHDG